MLSHFPIPSEMVSQEKVKRGGEGKRRWSVKREKIMGRTRMGRRSIERKEMDYHK